MTTVFYNSFADLNEKLAQLRAKLIQAGCINRQYLRLKPHTARVLIKSWEMAQATVDGSRPTKRPLSIYQKRLQVDADVKKIILEIAHLHPVPGFHDHSSKKGG